MEKARGRHKSLFKGAVEPSMRGGKKTERCSSGARIAEENGISGGCKGLIENRGKVGSQQLPKSDSTAPPTFPSPPIPVQPRWWRQSCMSRAQPAGHFYLM